MEVYKYRVLERMIHPNYILPLIFFFFFLFCWSEILLQSIPWENHPFAKKTRLNHIAQLTEGNRRKQISLRFVHDIISQKSVYRNHHGWEMYLAESVFCWHRCCWEVNVLQKNKQTNKRKPCKLNFGEPTYLFKT